MSSALSREYGSAGPDLILCPEIPFSEDDFLEAVSETHKRKGGVVVAASEGLKDRSGKPITPPIFKSDRSVYFGDVSSYLASIIVKRLSIKARSEKPGILGRSSIAWQSDVDRKEAVECGRASVKAALSGKNAYMSIIRRLDTPSYSSRVETVPISESILEARLLPASYLSSSGFDVSREFIDYAKPLAGNLGTEFLERRDSI